MDVRPLDLRQQHFRSAFRGFDRIEVSSFLLAVADDYERAIRDTERLRQDLARMEAVLIQHRENERTLKATLLAVQKVVDDLKADAERERRRRRNGAISGSDRASDPSACA